MASIHTGHRQRAKEEFLARGLSGLADHRVLELLLFYAVPQGDVNPLAHALVDRFGSLSGVLSAPYEELLKVKGVGPNTATLLRLILPVAARHMEQSSEVGGEYNSTWMFRELLIPLFLGARSEMAYLVCLDGKNKLLACRQLGEGIVDTVSITARKVMEAALSCNAARAVLAHNHVSGIAMYSAADVNVTREVSRLLRQVDIELMDHFVVAGDDMVSMRESGVFQSF
ncbi:MAG: DNA repair protein RadC [Oscillospiraceae bacterium]|nr:DNA repair protein RadC [Oscillospiraceae bacterium]